MVAEFFGFSQNFSIHTQSGNPSSEHVEAKKSRLFFIILKNFRFRQQKSNAFKKSSPLHVFVVKMAAVTGLQTSLDKRSE